MAEAAGQRRDEPPIESAPPGAFDLAPDDDELLTKDQVLGDQGCPGRDDGQDDVEQEAKEGDHGSERLPHGLFLARPGVRGGQVVGCGGSLRIWCRNGHLTIGETGSGPAHVRSICALTPDMARRTSAVKRARSNSPFSMIAVT
jgi:hypothetical protein